MIRCIPSILTHSKDATDGSDEVPLSRSVASKSKGEMRPPQHRKGIQPQDESDTRENELPRAHGEMQQRARRPSAGFGTSTATTARPLNSILGNKRRRRSSPGSETETDKVRRHGQPQGRQLTFMMKSPHGQPRKFIKTSQVALTITVSHHSCASVCLWASLKLFLSVASHTDPRRY